MDKIKDQFLNENPNLTIFANKTMICFANNNLSQFMGLFLAVYLFLFLILGCILIVSLHFRIKSSKNCSLFQSTYKMQHMLFKALLVQLINGIVFLLFPGLISGLLVYFRVENAGKICSILYCLVSFHAYMEYCILFYFVLPYRKALCQMFKIKSTDLTRLPITVIHISIIQK